MKTKHLSPLIFILVMCQKSEKIQAQEWPKPPNVYSWEGTWTPVFPLANMYDNYYYDGHEINGQATPVLPPGTWDWGQEHNLSNWNNFKNSIGHFGAISDNQNRIFGWKLIIDHLPADLTAGAAYFSGSPGIDILDLGPGSKVSSNGEISLNDGPDILRYEKGYSLFIRTGSSFTGSVNDNDVVIAGKNNVPADGSVDIGQTTISTGPGNDLVFVNNMGSAGVDVGCGAGGRTDATDPNDGNDIVVYGGNMNDFRFTGGTGNDLAIWYADEVEQQAAGWTWLGPNFFGGGSWGNALWEDKGTDRLIMAISPNTIVKNTYGAPPAGQLNVYLLNNYSPNSWIDGPTEGDPYARYCVTCGIGPGERKTITLEYVSPDGKVFTGRFWLTAFEELQVGIGPGAKVYKLDDINGKAILDNSLIPNNNPPLRNNYNQIITNYINGLNITENIAPGYPPTTETGQAEFYVYPNPSTEKLTIKYIAEKSSDCTISLNDINGLTVLNVAKKAIEGENFFQFDVSKINGGVYFLTLKDEKNVYNTKLLIN